jgi:riboflavin kinase/FMN adenylyltransferase
MQRPVLALTFSPHPRVFFGKTDGWFPLTDDHEKDALLRAYGAHATLFLAFERNVASLSGEGFVADVLQRMLEATHVVIGHDFRFGSDLGSAACLAQLGDKAGFGVTIIPPVMFNERRISSTNLRRSTQTGDETEVSALVGRPKIAAGANGSPLLLSPIGSLTALARNEIETLG